MFHVSIWWGLELCLGGGKPPVTSGLALGLNLFSPMVNPHLPPRKRGLNKLQVILDIGTHLPGMALPKKAWVRLNCLRTGVGRFHSCLHKWGMAPSAACEFGQRCKSRQFFRDAQDILPDFPEKHLCDKVSP